ncbi:MAG: flagellar motor switch protein FliG [Gammaproteobacteria bacterium]|jgi:flagellar motor switch protein FliG|nr:flagellar motor switch protein FliG [Gammaproteobacteria bacterium]
MDRKKQVSTTSVSSVERAAILLLSLGEQNAAEVLKLIGPKEVHRVSSAMAGLKQVSSEQADAVLNDFVDAVGKETSYAVGSREYLRNVLVKALGEERAGSILERVLSVEDSAGLEQLKWMDSRAIVDVVKLEHPQIIAVVLSYLDCEQAAEVLAQLPDKLRADVLLRVAVLDRLQPSALQELNRVIEEQFLGSSAAKSSGLGGVKVAADILNLVEPAVEGVIMDQVAEYNNELAARIQDLMFVFDDLSGIGDRDIQTLLREVSSDTLVLALKGADERVKEKMFRNMSKRAAEMLRDDLEAKGPVRLSEVESSQKEILAVARRLNESGDISLGAKGGEEYV